MSGRCKSFVRSKVSGDLHIVRSEANLKGFVDRFETAEAWLKILKSPTAMEAGAGL